LAEAGGARLGCRRLYYPNLLPIERRLHPKRIALVSVKKIRGQDRWPFRIGHLGGYSMQVGGPEAGVEIVDLAANDLEEAKREAWRRWKEHPYASEVEGYVI
jgi:hypothetical protein